MELMHAIENRRSVRDFTDRAIDRHMIERLLNAAVLAPNHRMTQPWRFYVLGPNARRAYGDVLGGRKAKKIEDPAAAQAVRDKIATAHQQLPAMVVFAMVEDDNPEIREEDYASLMMAIENFSLAAVAESLATHMKTGAIMQDPAARRAAGVPDGEKIVAVVELGEPASMPSPKDRKPATMFTTWLD